MENFPIHWWACALSGEQNSKPGADSILLKYVVHASLQTTFYLQPCQHLAKLFSLVDSCQTHRNTPNLYFL